MQVRNLKINSCFKNTSKISFVLGVYSGYGHNNMNANMTQYSYDDVCRTIIEFIEENKQIIGEVSWTIEPVRCLYSPKYGCPEVGEHAYRLSSVYNPAYESTEKDWFDSCICHAYYLAKHFGQSTVTIEYIEGESNKPMPAQLGVMYIKINEDVIEE